MIKNVVKRENGDSIAFNIMPKYTFIHIITWNALLFVRFFCFPNYIKSIIHLKYKYESTLFSSLQ